MSRAKKLKATLQEMDELLKGDLENKDPKLLARLSRDKRLSKELQSALRSYAKLVQKYNQTTQLIRVKGYEERNALVEEGYGAEIQEVINTLKEVIPNVWGGPILPTKISTRYLQFVEGSDYFGVFFDSERFFRQYTRLRDNEIDELLSLYKKDLQKRIEVALPGLVNSLGDFDKPKWLFVLGYGAVGKGYGGHWKIPKREIIKYLES